MVLQILNKNKRARNSPIKEFYILTYPFCDTGDEYNFQDYLKLWKQSLSKAAEREGVFAILYFCEYLSNSAIKLDKQLVKHAKNMFGQHRILLHRSDAISIHGIFNKQVRERIVDRKTTKVTGRGVYGAHCVEGVVEETCSAYNIPYEKGSIDWLESPDSCGDAIGNRTIRETFPNTDDRREMKTKLSETEYSEWLNEKLEKFRIRICSDAWGWAYNLNTIRIKTYLGDKDFLKKKFGDLRLESLTEEDFNDFDKGNRIAIVYQFLANPLSLYGVPKQYSTDRFHVNPPFPDLDDPKPWGASRDEIFQFRADLSRMLLGKDVIDTDISTLTNIVDRATEKHKVVMCVD